MLPRVYGKASDNAPPVYGCRYENRYALSDRKVRGIYCLYGADLGRGAAFKEYSKRVSYTEEIVFESTGGYEEDLEYSSVQFRKRHRPAHPNWSLNDGFGG